MNPTPNHDPDPNDGAAEVANESSTDGEPTPDLPDDVAENLGDFA